MKRFLLSAILMLAIAVPGYPQTATPSDIDYDTVSNPDLLTQLLQDLFTYYQGVSVLFSPQDSAPTGSEGKVYYNDAADALYLYTTSWKLIGTENGTSLDGAYDLGNKIDVDGDVLELEVDDGSNNSALHIDHDEATNDNTAVLIENAADAANAITIDIDAQTTGRDIEGTGASWYVDGTGGLTAVAGTFSGDVQVTGSNYNINFDVSRDQLSFADNAVLGIGGADNAAGDFTFKFDGTNLVMESAAGDDAFTLGATTNFDVVIHGGTSTNEVTFDTDDSALLCIFDGFDLRMNDDDKLIFGDSSEFVVEYDEDGDNDLVFVAGTANAAIQIGDGTTGTDFVLQSSGGANNEVRFDASGDTNVGQLLIGADDYGIDAYFYGATASQVVTWDQSADTWYFGDDAEGVDVYFNGDTTGQYVLWDESADTWYFGADAEGVDVYMNANTTGDFVFWDESDEQLEWVGAGALFDDDSDAFFGSDKDWSITSDTATELDILPVTTDESSILNVGADTAGADVKFFGATTGEYWLWDASADSILPNCGNALFTMTDAEANQFKVDATGTVAGYAIVLETTAGGVQINADGATQGDIAIDAADDMTLTAAGDLTLAVTGTLSAGGAIITNQKKTVTVDIDDRVIAATESGSVFTNGADTDTSVFTLPTAAAGLYFTFCDVEAGAAADLCILANTGDKIQGGTAAEYYNCYDDTYGSSVTLLAVDAEEWVVISSVGTWTADSDTTAP